MGVNVDEVASLLVGKSPFFVRISKSKSSPGSTEVFAASLLQPFSEAKVPSGRLFAGSSHAQAIGAEKKKPCG